MDEKNGSFVFDNDTSANSNSPRGFNLDEDMVVVIPVVTIGLLIVALTIFFIIWRRVSSRNAEDAESVHELGPSQQLPLMPENIEDEAMASVHFSEGFTRRYGHHGSMFFHGSLNNAMKEAFHQPACDRKLFALYLHHDGSILSNIFCTQVLCSETVVSLLTTNFIIWGWDLTANSNRHWLLNNVAWHSLVSVRNFEKDVLPLLLIVTRSRDTNIVLAEIAGSVNVDEMMTRLLKTVEMFSQQQHDEITEEEDREKREMYEREQDEANQLTFQADRAEEELKRQGEAVKLRQVEEQRVHEEQEFNELIAELNRYEAIAHEFSSHQSHNSLMLHLQTTVTLRLNEICDESGQNLQNDLNSLRNLLKGIAFNVGTNRAVSANSPRLEYLTIVLVKKFVERGDVKHQETFALAAVITELWLEFPVFGRLILANFYRQCPYLVPMYPHPQQEGQSEEEFYKSLGFQYRKGKRENQSEYFKRMSNIVRLYAAVTISVPRHDQLHPHGLQQAWKYLLSLLNLPPRSDITAFILVEFLTVTGNAMEAKYGEQFHSVLDFIRKDFIAKIRAVTTEVSGGIAVNSLQDFLNKSMGGIAPPDGLLPPGFW